MALIKIDDVTIVRAGKEVVSHFSAEIAPGKITAIIGPNGSGKTSLMSALAGDLPIASGSISFDGKDLSGISTQEQATIRSVVQQNRNYWLSYTVREVIEMGQDEESLQRVDHIMSALEINGFANQKVTTLSGGEAQRIEIARALIRDTDIYLLDEPLSAQDSGSKQRIISLLSQLRDQGKTIVIIAHIDKGALTWCDQVIETLAQ
jgi:ABC-type cobalamin/Fe3+-siderophores transport system ATPase subunit